MKQRKPSDPLSWFYQAAIHGVTDQLVSDAAKTDANVLNVDKVKYWNQCPHKGENSANFLPWHRGYTFHFENILRMHTEEDDFALPYWDYSAQDQRMFPREFGIQHLDGNAQNEAPENINSLFHAERDYFLCGYEHPFTDQLPLTELSSRAVDATKVMNCPVFFGDIESEGVGGGIADTDSSTRGLLEQSPHDQVHRAVGGNVQGTDGAGNPSFALGGMALPPTAGFDPIFPVHHANMDRLWARWACLPGKTWGRLPPASWFDERPWFFFDTDGKEVNRPRRDYFDHAALGVRFKDEDPNCKPLALPAIQVASATMAHQPRSIKLSETAEIEQPIDAPTGSVTRVALATPTVAREKEMRAFGSRLAAADRSADRMTLTVREVQVGAMGGWGFDVFLVPARSDLARLTPGSDFHLGSISLFNHHGGGAVVDQTFDITTALAKLGRRDLGSLDVVFVPYQLTTMRRAGEAIQPPQRRLKASGFRISRVPAAYPQRSPEGQHAPH